MLKQPVGFVKLTNIALIKYKTNGKKFEIACYKNKVLNWRNGVQNDLSEVVQNEEIYTNAAQGEVASNAILEKSFPEKTKSEILMLILEKGEMQISQKERETLMENYTNDIINIISAKIVHPKTKRVFSLENIRAAIKESSIQFNLNKSTKKQAMDAINVLLEKYLIEKVGMLIKATFSEKNDFKLLVEGFQIEVRSENDKESVFLVPHKVFSDIEAKGTKDFKDKVILIVLDNNFIEKEIMSIDNANDGVMMLRPVEKQDGATKKKKGNGKIKNEILKDLKEDEIEAKEVIGNKNLATLTNMMDKKEAEVKVCHTCLDLEFKVVMDYKNHIKSDFHKFNLQRKMKNETSLNYDDFQNNLLMHEFVSVKIKGKK